MVIPEKSVEKGEDVKVKTEIEEVKDKGEQNINEEKGESTRVGSEIK